MPNWIRKPRTLAHPLEVVLQDKNGPIDITAGSTVEFRAKMFGATSTKFDAAGTVVNPGAPMNDPDRGRVMYTLNTADIDTPGIYEVDIFVTIAGLGTQPFPEDGNMWLLVLPGADEI